QKLLARHVVPTTPVQVRYTLTPQGRELIVILQPLVSWGVRWKLQPSE
ncbi:MAG: Transcriptional regulator, partial [Microbacteriaceae bacterium]|nr:Transcriptional regulator [Microbacteriaceae bacterium]